MQGEQPEMDDTTTLHGLGGAAAPSAHPVAEGDAGSPDAEAEAVIEALAQGTALLVVQQGPSAGARFLLDAAVTTVGRHPDNDIFLDDITVSRHHATFQRVAAGFEVRDVGSLNGTYVNRSAVERTVLAGGDEVQIGKFRLVFHGAPAQAQGTA